MRIIKKLNNNAAVAIYNEKECIVLGIGIGFGEMPYKLEDMSLIDKVFYDEDEYLYNILQSIPSDLITITSKIHKNAEKELNTDLNNNFIIVLADHINFSIKKILNGYSLGILYSEEVKFLYPKEYEFARKALNFVNSNIDIELPDEEIVNITLHLVNSSFNNSNKNESIMLTRLLNKATQILENVLNQEVQKENTQYAQFISILRKHIYENPYVIVNNRNNDIYMFMKENYKDTMIIIDEIERSFYSVIEKKFSNQTKILLGIYINNIIDEI